MRTHSELVRDYSIKVSRKSEPVSRPTIWSLFRRELDGSYTRVSDASYVDLGIAQAVYMNRIIESGLNYKIRAVL